MTLTNTMEENIDFKYFGHDREEEIAELENLSDYWVLTTKYDKEKKILVTKTKGLVLRTFLIEIFLLTSNDYSYTKLFSN